VDGKFDENDILINDESDRNYVITMDGQNMEVTRNLYQALLHLRDDPKEDRAGDTRVLWVDAICIDQKNNAEKGEQIRSMARIYKQATRVLMWLGESDEKVDLAFDTVEELCWTVTARLAQWSLHKKPEDDSERELVATLGLGIKNLDEYLALHPDLKTLEGKGAMAVLVREFIVALFATPSSQQPLSSDIQNAANTRKEIFAQYSSAQFSTWCTGLPSTFMDSRPIVPYLLPANRKFSDHHTFKARMDAVRGVFSSRKYWSRLWILQEVLHAREAVMLCGKRRMNFSNILLLLSLNRQPAKHYCPIFPGLILSDDYRGALEMFASLRGAFTISVDTVYSRWEGTLEKALTYYTGRNSSDPRDAIYAILSMIGPTTIQVSYDKPVAQVFTEATAAVIRESQNIGIICLIGDEGTHRTNTCPPNFELPSWVPNFASTSSSKTCGRTFSRGHYDAGGQIQNLEKTLALADIGVLHISGRFYETIAQKTKIQDSTDILSLIRMLLGAPIRSTGEKLWTSIVADLYNEVRISKSREAEKAFNTDVVRCLATRLVPLQLRVNIEALLFGRALCFTSRGPEEGFVIAPWNVEIEDHIFVVRGSRSPLILRQVYEGTALDCLKSETTLSAFYRCIGASYVRGIMDGEALKGINSRRLRRIMGNGERVSVMDAEVPEEDTVYLI
jgi:hypothetical protein